MKEVLIIGGGVIGLSIGHSLSKGGHAVRIIERDPELENSCSSGNAGMIVPSHFIPLAAPGVISQGLKWMLNPKSPFFLRPRLDPALARWIWLFMRHSNIDHVSKSEPLLRDLSLLSRKLHLDLAREENFPLIDKGLLMLCQTQKGLDDEAEVVESAHRLGLQAELIGQSRIAELEPSSVINAIGGILFPQDCHLDPTDFTRALRQSITRHGGEFIQDEAISIGKDGIRTKTGATHRADTTILAGGISSLDLSHQLSLKLPMQGGKGYSLTLPKPLQNPRLCSLLKEGRVAVTPMGDQLRVAGTMEICGKDTTISKPRLQGIIESFCSFYPEFSPQEFAGLEPWVGLRPCSPDGLPYIGKVPGHDNVIIATGHSMMGLSLAPVTGQLIADLVDEKEPTIPISALAPERFG